MTERATPGFFKRGPSLLLRFAFFALLSLMLLFIDLRFQLLNKIREPVSAVLYPLQWAATAPLRFLAFSRDFLTQHTALLQENRRLANQTLLMQAKLMQFEHVQQENAVLRTLLQLKQNKNIQSVLVQIRYYGYDPFFDKIIVDRGEQDGVKVGQPVLSEAGLLGQVTRVQPFSSEIRLIVDKDFPVPARVVRNGLHVVVYGGVIPNTLEVRFLPFNSDIKVGDRLVTSGLDDVYPPGIAIATVKSVETGPGSLFARVVCESFAKPQAESYALIVTHHQKDAATDSAAAVATVGAN